MSQQKPRATLLIILCFCLAGYSIPVSKAFSQNPVDGELPNIVLMMADDMGMGDTSAYQDITGNSSEEQIYTPNMERLAKTGIRFADAHTPSSRCTGTRYGLLTGRYPWRNRMKHWVLFGSQGDPMIEEDRPTIASILKDCGYRTGMVGKWHVGLRYRQTGGKPASGWQDADLTQPLWTSPLDHGFDFVRFTSRSHGTSGPDAAQSNPQKRKNNGPGHVHGRRVMAATGKGKNLKRSGPHAYVHSELGSRHFSNAMDFLETHVRDSASKKQPFFLYYPANSNHGPYTPDVAVAGKPVAGASRTKSGDAMNKRYDFIYENDVALGGLLDWLSSTPDPRLPGKKLIENTLVIFTSDNGAENKSKVATGPFRSNKGSAFEGGHRVPFIASWPRGGVGSADGEIEAVRSQSDRPTPTSQTRVDLTDLFATFCEITGQTLPDLRRGEKGGEDSFSILAAMQGVETVVRHPIFHNDHNEAKQDHASMAVRLDNPVVDGKVFAGKWKLFFDSQLVRYGRAAPYALYDLAEDPREENNLLQRESLQPLADYLTEVAVFHRNCGGHRYADFASSEQEVISFQSKDRQESREALEFTSPSSSTAVSVQAKKGAQSAKLLVSAAGLAAIGADSIAADDSSRIDAGEVLEFRFATDVIVDSIALRCGDGTCGGYYQVGEGAPLALYCVDADNDSQDQSGNLSDIGLIRAGQKLRLSSEPHYGVEPPGAWTVEELRFRVTTE